MKALGITLGAMLSVLTVGIAQASETFVPEVLTVEKTIKPGANVFVLDQSWSGPTRINVLSADDLEHKGILAAGLIGQMAFSKDHKTAYTISAYAKRITYGPTEAVLQEFDVDTLSGPLGHRGARGGRQGRVGGPDPGLLRRLPGGQRPAFQPPVRRRHNGQFGRQRQGRSPRAAAQRQALRTGPGRPVHRAQGR